MDNIIRLAGSKPRGTLSIRQNSEKQSNRIIDHLVHADRAGQGKAVTPDHDELAGTNHLSNLRAAQPYQADIAITAVKGGNVGEKGYIANYSGFDLVQEFTSITNNQDTITKQLPNYNNQL
jgi:hypothetical protein